MAVNDYQTLGDLLTDPRIRDIAPEAIRNRDLRKEALWNKTLAQLKAEHFGGEIGGGLERLYAAAETGDWYYPLYSEAENAEDEKRRGTNIVWFPAEDPAADRRPFILLVPGGGFVNVWNLTEGWPIGAQFNQLGYHVFILTYQVDRETRQLDACLEDTARALRMIKEKEAHFHVQGDRYITCGFSAGGYLVCLWNTLEKGYAAFGLPKPRATFPIYPFVSPKLDPNDDETDDGTGFYGCTEAEAVTRAFEIPEHAEGFPPSAIFLAAGDELVNPEHSRLLAAALEKLSIPCRLEIGPEGGHGFADGTGMCMAGWPERAIRWYESLQDE